MKKSILLLGLVIASILLNASPIDPQTAQTVSRNFWIANGGNRNVEWMNITSQTSFTEFYIFSNAGGEGFIIVAADDCVVPILGYSLSNVFDPKMPAQIAEYLNGMNQEIVYWKAQNLPVDSELSATWSSLIDGSYTPRNLNHVLPLISTTWNQSPYYNSLCPSTGTSQAVTGCVATAMAQVMKFWNWPSKGTGSNTYYHATYGVLSADFGNTIYQWSQMPNALNGNSSAAQVNAVATLMYHVGVSVEMDYGTTSGAYTHDYGSPVLPCPKYALIHYFKYKNTIHSVYKNDVSDAAWANIIKNELDAGRPVLHSGRDSTSGHAFICDGYDLNDLFHINWGWGGSNDGFYFISNLSPASGGTGTNATNMFNLDRGIVVGIEPDRDLHTSTHDLAFLQNGGSQTFLVFPGNGIGGWTATSSQPWLSVSPSNGNEDTTTVTATASVNNTGAARTAIIDISHGAQTCTINVIQNGCSDSDMCAVILTKNAIYNDGWAGASITVSSTTGYPYGTYTLMGNNTTATDTILICPSDISLSWNSGLWDNRCSFSLQNASGTTLLSRSSIDTSNSTWTIYNPCSSNPIVNCTVNALPWNEDFESDIDCWSTIDADGDGNNWSTTTNAPHSGTHAICSYSNEQHQALHANNYLISPEITLPANGNYKLSFYTKSADVTHPDSLIVKLSTSINPTIGDFTTTLMPKTAISTNSYQLHTLILDNHVGQTIRLAFIHQSYNGSFLSIDDISIEPYTPVYTITVNTSNSTMGSISGSGSFDSGTTDTLFAYANSNYRFTGWSDGNTENPRVITVTGNATYTANFADLGNDVLQYDNGFYETAMGAGRSIHWAVCFPASELTNYSHLSSVRIADIETGSYQLSIYQGGTSAPGTLKSSQTFTLPGNNNWFECTLNPVTLDPSQNLWLVFYNHDADYPAAASNYAGNPNGSWVSTDGTNWSSICDIGYNLTWMIRAVLSSDNSNTITVISANSSMGSTSGSGPYASGSTDTLFAYANNNYRFTKWNDGNTQNPRIITVTGDATYIANFTNLGDSVLQYDNGSYKTATGGGGSFYWGVCFPASELTDYSHLTAVRILDAAAGSYQIRIYQGGTSAPGTLKSSQTFTLTGSHNWFNCALHPVALDPTQNLWLVFYNHDTNTPASSANYAGNPNGSWVSTDGTNWSSICDQGNYLTWMIRAVLGTPPSHNITVNSANTIMGSATGSGSYVHGAADTLFAYANNHYRFTGWNDGNTENPRVITVTGNTTYTANFADLGDDILQYDNGSFETSMGAGGNLYWGVCFPASELTGYQYLNAVRIVDVAAGSYLLRVYQGGTSAPGTLIRSQVFTLTGSHNWSDCTLSSPISLDTTQNLWLVFYNHDTDHPASATHYAGNPNGSWVSTDDNNWSSVCDLGYNITWMMRAVLSDGSTPYYNITVNSEDTIMGSVSGSGTYQEGTQITISAIAANYYHFTSWNDGNTDNPRTITVTGDTTYTAYFAANQYVITVNSANPDMGSVSGNGTYPGGTQITISAIASNHYHFTRWDDGNTDNPRTITVTEDATYTAYFAAEQYVITVNSADPTMGTVTGGGIYDYDSVITISATANPNFKFTRWNDENTDNPRTITVEEDATYTAYFQSTIGIEDLSLNNISIFSIDDQVHILNAAGLAVGIYDMTGRLIVYDVNNSNPDRVFTISTNGVYLVKVGAKYNKKVIIFK